MTEQASEVVGFIGLGTMGRPMALNLIKAGYKVHVPDRASLYDDLRQISTVERDIASVARSSTVIILMLPDTKDVEQVLFGERGICTTDLAGKLVIDMSSISPTATASFATRVAAKGETGAIAGTLTIMMGGPRQAITRAEPILNRVGNKLTHIGESNGAGQACKLANQIIVASNIQAVAEAFALMERHDVDLTTVRGALLGGFAASRVLEVHGQRMIEGTFNPGFRIELHLKDIRLALAAGAELGATLPTSSMLEHAFQTAVDQGAGGKDHSYLMSIARQNAQSQR
jgi:2-hydroxy-3-oxopropionate reductase